MNIKELESSYLVQNDQKMIMSKPRRQQNRTHDSKNLELHKATAAGKQNDVYRLTKLMSKLEKDIVNEI